MKTWAVRSSRMTDSRGSSTAASRCSRTTCTETKAPGRSAGGGSTASTVSLTVPVAVSTTGEICRILPATRCVGSAASTMRTSRPGSRASTSFSGR